MNIIWLKEPKVLSSEPKVLSSEPKVLPSEPKLIPLPKPRERISYSATQPSLSALTRLGHDISILIPL